MQDPNEDVKSRPAPRSAVVILAICTGIIGIILALSFAFKQGGGMVMDKADSLVRDTGKEAKKLAGNFLEVWSKAITVRPEIRIDQRTVIGQSTNIFEVATARKEIYVRYDYESEGFGKKRLELEGTYLVQAGFDFQESFSISIDTSNRVVIATLPRPAVLTVQRKNYLHLKETEAFFSRINTQEREIAINALDAMAKRQARASGIQQDAKRFLENQLRELAQQMEMEIRFIYPDEMNVQPRKD